MQWRVIKIMDKLMANPMEPGIKPLVNLEGKKEKME